MRAILLAACAALIAGCSSTPTGVRIVASSATATNIGDIAWDEYKIPVFSVYTGPKTTIWINRNYLALSKVTAGGCVTNDTSALGVYSSKERKETRVELELSPCSTNATYLAAGESESALAPCPRLGWLVAGGGIDDPARDLVQCTASRPSGVSPASAVFLAGA